MIRITVSNYENIPQNFIDSDGLVSLDLFDSSKIALTKVIDDFIEAGSIKQDTFRQFKIPISKKNRLIIGNLGNPSALNVNHAKVYDIALTNGVYSYPVQGLQVSETLEQDCSYLIALFGELNDWYRPLSQFKLNDVELGSAVVDYAFIQQQNNFAIYDENQAPVIAPLVNYGRWFIECNQEAFSDASAQVVYNNFRWWFSPMAILKQIFCQIGYTFSSPYMETERFRKIWAYLLDPDFETANQLDVSNRVFEATRSTDLQFDGVFNQSTTGRQVDGVLNMGFSAVLDPGGHYFTRPSGSGFPIENFYGSFYSGGMIGIFSFVGTVNYTPTNAPTIILPISPSYINLKISIKKSPKFGFDGQDRLLSKATVLASKEYIYKSGFVNGASIDFDFNINTGSIKVYQHEVVYVHVELEANLVNTAGQEFDASYLYPDMSLLTGATFNNIVELQVIEEGDTLEWGKLLRKDWTGLDLFKGIMHLDDQKIESNAIYKTIETYPEFIIDLGGTDGIQEAFFKPNQEEVFDATEKIQANSLVQRFVNRELGRDLYLKFKDSTDGFIASKNLEDNPYSKRIDFGEEFIDGDNVIENPFFEPTLNAIDYQLGGLADLGGPSVNYIPFMWEGEAIDDIYPDIGFDYGARIAIAHENGVFRVELDPTVTGLDSTHGTRFMYEDTLLTEVLIFGQIFPEGARRRDPFGTYPINDTIVYGSQEVNDLLPDLYSMIYLRAIRQSYFGISLEFLVKLDLIDLSVFSFRTKWRIKYDSKAWGEIEIYARVSRMDDFVINDCLTTPVQLVPDNNNFTNC